MAAIDAEAADRREHVQGVLSNRVVGVVGQWHRFVRGAAAAPVDSDDPEVVRNEWSDEVEPHAAGEIPVDEHHRVLTGPPLRVIQPDLADIDEHGLYHLLSVSRVCQCRGTSRPTASWKSVQPGLTTTVSSANHEGASSAIGQSRARSCATTGPCSLARSRGEICRNGFLGRQTPA